MARVGREVGPIAGSALALTRREIGAGEMTTIGDTEADTFLYVVAGTGSLSLGDARTLAPRTAVLVQAGEEARVDAHAYLDLVVATVGADVDCHAPMGPRELTSSLDDATAQAATGARSFQVMFDASTGSTRATLFAGFVPPGRAPWHYHLYDEIVWIPDGPGQLHLEGSIEELGPGAAFRLRPREVHIVENTSPDRELTIIGLFTPAGSPSAAYLTPEVAAEYRFAG